MTVDLSNKKIIMVHGLGSKPTPEITHDLWRRTLIENIRVSHKLLAQSLDVHQDIFESAYWANFVPHHIPDDAAYSKKLRLQVDKVINERREIKDRFHVGAGERVSSFFKDRGLDLVKLLAGALTVKDDVMTRFLRETERPGSVHCRPDAQTSRRCAEARLGPGLRTDCRCAQHGYLHQL